MRAHADEGRQLEIGKLVESYAVLRSELVDGLIEELVPTRARKELPNRPDDRLVEARLRHEGVDAQKLMQVRGETDGERPCLLTHSTMMS